MGMQGKDPNREARNGGYLDVGLYDMGNGTGAIVTLPLTATKTTVTPSTTSSTLLALNTARYTARITNTSQTANLWVTNGATATVGSGIKIPPGATQGIPPVNDSAGGIGPYTGAVSGILDQADGTAGATIIEFAV